ncbi:uncharacterized protein EDB91DRAFT_1088656 [Suillus paluster]|uniref:uncharacterized protein n=1 Tax=Suillus paluster TaxID=48578 RepID=UPI001B861805|nr:uncharacterized protein EDB91DRAFT_1088656 [Suillus paluster]KAG1720908.1 hypothetical protein EDB91DRAFT_1088656 [Suillus paluster]
MVPPRKRMSTSSRVTMTLLNHRSLKYESRGFAGSENSARFEELLAEAELEAGQDSLETMDFGGEIVDDSINEFAEDEPVGGPLLSEFFKTCSQEREPPIRGRIDVRTRTKRRQHANAAWKEQMPTLVDGYLAWRHEAPTDEDNTIASNMFHVDVVGISGKVSFLQYMALTYTQPHSKVLHMPSPSSSVLMNQRMHPSFAWDFWGAPHYG